MNRFQIHLASLITGGLFVTSPLTAQQHSADLVDTAVGAGSFQTLVKAVQTAGLVDTLKGGTFTVFAPTDEAFAKLPDGVLASLLEPENRDRLTAILTYHVVPGRLTAADVLAAPSLDTVNGQRVTVDAAGPMVDDARIVQTDVLASNGVIHAIDAVLLPVGDDIVDRAADIGKFETLYAAARAAGLVDEFRGDGPFTVFAPTDEAFAKIPRATLASLLEPANRDTLRRILRYHVIPGRVFADQAAAARRADTAADAAVTFAIRDGRLCVDDARVIATDVQAANGVIHVIDSVLSPPEKAAPRGRKYFGIRSETPGAALAAQLGIDRSRSSVVTDVVAGSAAAAAGLKRYDVIVAVAGGDGTSTAMNRAKADRDFGEEVRFEIFRGGKKQHLKIAIGEDRH